MKYPIPVADLPDPDPEEFPAIAELKSHAKKGGPMMIDRVLTEALTLIAQRDAARDRVVKVTGSSSWAHAQEVGS